MNSFKTFLAGAMLTTTATTAMAGGILTNTNQSIDFLRNPARDAAIGLDGVYSNPAGVAFMPQGFHLGLNWQYAHQTRTITSTNDVFKYGKKNNGSITKEYEGVADAPIIPSIQAAWNKGNWSLQFNFSVPGGGGKCSYDNGLGSFESVVGQIAQGFMTLDGAATQINGLLAQQGIAAQMPVLGVTGYDMDSYMQGRQYYFGVQIGAAYKVNEKVSVYGGLRLLYGDATYRARISNIQVGTGGGYQNFSDFLPQAQAQAQACTSTLATLLAQVQQGIAQYEAAGAPVPDALRQNEATLKAYHSQLSASETRLGQLWKYSDGVNLLCNQTSLGVAPVVSVDFKPNDHFNFAAKYEFKTQIRMKNESTVFEASEIDAVNKYRDGDKVNEDMPAMLTVGAQWSPVRPVRINAGAHYYFDKQANWYNESQKKLAHNSYELLAGAEWDISDRITISAGGQITRYGNTDDYMNDISFVVNSYSIGFGMNCRVSKNVKLKAAFFQTEYGNYSRETSPTVKDSFTRTNRVLGLGCDIDI